MKRKPDMMLVLMVLFGLGVVVTLLLPMMSSDSVAEPASALQTGVIYENNASSAFN